MMPLAPFGEMETDACCKETKEPAVESEVREAISGPADKDNETEKEQTYESVREHEEAHGNRDDEPESQCGGSECTGTKTSAPKGEKRQDGKTLEKRNSFKTVRFVSIAEAGEGRDSSAENLFPEYETEEWTSSTFEDLFAAEDWEDITGNT